MFHTNSYKISVTQLTLELGVPVTCSTRNTISDPQTNEAKKQGEVVNDQVSKNIYLSNFIVDIKWCNFLILFFIFVFAFLIFFFFNGFY